jgi:HEAT repeat protein
MGNPVWTPAMWRFLVLGVLGLVAGAPALRGEDAPAVPAAQKDTQDPAKDLETFNKQRNDGDEKKRIEAVKLLAKYNNDRRILEALVKVVKDGNGDKMKQEAAKQLAAFNAFRDRLVTKDVARVLDSSWGKDDLQIELCRALGSLGDDSCGPTLLKFFNHGNRRIARAAIEAAGKIKAKSCLNAMVVMIKEFDALGPTATGDPANKRRDLQASIITALSGITGQSFTTAKEWDEWVRKQREDEVKKLLDEFTKGMQSAKNDNDRAAVIFNLAQSPLRDPKLFDKIKGLMSGGSELVRGEAIGYVSLYTDDREAARSLLNALGSNKANEKLVEKILSAISKMPPDPYAESSLIGYAREEDNRVAGYAIRALSEQGSARSVDVMLKIYERIEKEKKSDLRDEAKKKHEERVKYLEPALKDSLSKMAGKKLESFDDATRWWTENRNGFKSPADKERDQIAQKEKEERLRAKENEKKALEASATPPPPKAVAGDGTGLAGHYYKGRDFRDLKLSRVDPTIDFDWGDGEIDPAVGADELCIRWTGQVLPQFTETYTFSTFTDDGCRLWVNGQKLIDEWRDKAADEATGTIALKAGEKVDIKLEYYEKNGQAACKLLWSSPSTAKDIIPKTQLFPGELKSPGAVVAKPADPKPAAGGEKRPDSAPAPAAAAPPAVTPTNFIVNGGMETGDLSGWTVFGGDIVVTNASPQDGTYIAQMVGGNGMYLSQKVEGKLEAGKTYVVTGWVKIVPGEGRRGITRLRVGKLADLSKGDFGEATASGGTMNEWQKLEVTCTFAAEDVENPIFVGFRQFGFAGTVHVDAVSLFAK